MTKPALQFGGDPMQIHIIIILISLLSILLLFLSLLFHKIVSRYAHVPVTRFLFSDDLQTKLTHIKTTNKIRVTATATIQGKQRLSHHFKETVETFISHLAVS